MPVTPITPAAPAAAPRAPAQVAGGFDELLASATHSPAARTSPSLSLGQMVASFAGAQVEPGLEGIGDRPVASPSGDGWGVGVERSDAAQRAAVDGGAGAEVIEAGERYLGVPYKWGGTSASTGFDCSGFVQQVYADLGVSLPRVSVDQSRAGSAVGSMAEAQPGDLIFWRASGGRPNHIGIYAGDGQMLVAPRTGDVVRYQQISRTPDAIRRVVA